MYRSKTPKHQWKEAMVEEEIAAPVDDWVASGLEEDAEGIVAITDVIMSSKVCDTSTAV